MVLFGILKGDPRSAVTTPGWARFNARVPDTTGPLASLPGLSSSRRFAAFPEILKFSGRGSLCFVSHCFVTYDFITYSTIRKRHFDESQLSRKPWRKSAFERERKLNWDNLLIAFCLHFKIRCIYKYINNVKENDETSHQTVKSASIFASAFRNKSATMFVYCGSKNTGTPWWACDENWTMETPNHFDSKFRRLLTLTSNMGVIFTTKCKIVRQRGVVQAMRKHIFMICIIKKEKN